MAKLTKEYKNLLFDLFYEGFDLVYGSTGKFPWYAALIKDCEEDIDGFLSYRYKDGNKWKELSDEESRIIPQEVYNNFLRIRDILNIPDKKDLEVDTLVKVRNSHDEKWMYAYVYKVCKHGIKVYANGTSSKTSQDGTIVKYKYYKWAD